MMRHIIFIMGFCTAFGPLSAAAQPLFETEHDWTIDIGDATFGLQQHVQQPGDFRSTTVFLGWYGFETNWQAPHILGVTVVLLVTAIIGIIWSEWRYRRWHSSKSPPNG